MSATRIVEVDCPVCAGRRRKRLFEVRDYANPSFKDRFGVCRCVGCGAGYLSPRPAEEDLGGYYKGEFYWSFEGGTVLTPDAVLAARRTQIEAKRAFLADLRPGRLLDVGAMKGEFVYVMRQQGWHAEGIELSPLAENLFGVPIRQGDLTTEAYEPAQFDCVTFWAVLEHVYEPAKYIDKAAQLLKQGGRLVVIVTNFNSFQGRVLRMDDYPRHLTLFTAGSLNRLLCERGFKVSRMFTSQQVFGSSAYGGLVTAAKLAGGYSMEEVLYERRDPDPLAFCCAWRKRPSQAVLWTSRLDRALSLPIERALDRLGFGHTLACVAHRA